MMSVAFFYRAFSYSRVVFGMLWGIAITAIFAGKIVLYNLERWQYRRGKDLRHAVIIGDSATANRIYFRLSNNPLLGYKFIGYFADHECLKIDPLGGAQWLGRLADVPHLLQKFRIELAIVAIDSREHDTLNEVIEECEGVNAEFMIVPDFVEIMASRMAVKEIEGIPFVRLKGVPMTTWGRIVKRLSDFLVSIVLIILLSPVFVLLAVLIKLTSSGPVFFLQERVGLDGVKFKMIKFRSMKAGAELHDKFAGLGVPNDPAANNFRKIFAPDIS